MSVTRRPSVFVREGVLCARCFVREKRKWVSRFVEITDEAITVYEDDDAWKRHSLPLRYTSLSETMVVSLAPLHRRV